MTFTDKMKFLVSNFKSFSFIKTQDTAIAEYDFKLETPQKALLKLCFAHLSNVYLILFGLILSFIPKMGLFLHSYEGIARVLLSPNWGMPLLLGFILTRMLTIPCVLIVAILLAQYFGATHILFSFFFIYGVLLGTDVRRFILAQKVESKIKRILMYTSLMSFIALGISLWMNVNLYLYFSYSGLFNQSMYANRLEFLVLALVVMSLWQLIVSGTWGYFYSRQKADESKLIIHFSTIEIWKKLKLSRATKEAMKASGHSQLQSLTQSYSELNQVASLSSLLKGAKKEIEYLKRAESEIKV